MKSFLSSFIQPRTKRRKVETSLFPIVLHISGSPGSGKTTLGRLIQKQYPKRVKVVDTDSFISWDQGKQLEKKYPDLKENKQAWEEMFSKAIVSFYENTRDHEPQVRVIIFTGILAHWSPDGSPMDFPLKDVVAWQQETFTDLDQLFFLTLDFSTLLVQYYEREISVIKATPKFYNDMITEKVNEDLVIEAYIPSLMELTVGHASDIAFHEKRGYLRAKKELIFWVLKQILKKN